MNISTLHQFLQTLISPLKASEASQRTVADLERMMRGLEPFADKPVGDFASFLERAHGYERDGHWPPSSPPIKGAIVDRPSSADYAVRLKQFLEREVSASGLIPEAVFLELETLQSSIKLPQLKELAVACGIDGPPQKAPAVIAKTFEHVTGRKFGEAVLQRYHDWLRRSSGNNQQLDAELDKVQRALGVPQLQKLAKQFGVPKPPRSKKDLIGKIRQVLAPSPGEQPPALPRPSPDLVIAPDTRDEKLDGIVETLRELKRKADPEGAPYEEIEDELKRLEETMTGEQAIAAAKQIGVEWSVHTKAEAMNRIREKVFERKRIREKIQH